MACNAGKYHSGIELAWNALGENIVGEAEWDNSGNSISINSNGTVIAIGARGNDGSMRIMLLDMYVYINVIQTML